MRVRSCIACVRPGHVGLGGEGLDLRALHDELAHEVHELVEPLGVDADGAAAPLLGPARRRRPARRGGRARLGGLGGLAGARAPSTARPRTAATSGTRAGERRSAAVLGSSVASQASMRGRRTPRPCLVAGAEATQLAAARRAAARTM